MKSKWITLGKVAVDSGQLLISDPCYVDSHWRKDVDHSEGHPGEFSYGGCCKKTDDEGGLGGQLLFNNGVPGAGVAFTSGFGDGLYDVEAKIKNFGKNCGTRITEVRIKLIEED